MEKLNSVSPDFWDKFNKQTEKFTKFKQSPEAEQAMQKDIQGDMDWEPIKNDSVKALPNSMDI